MFSTIADNISFLHDSRPNKYARLIANEMDCAVCISISKEKTRKCKLQCYTYIYCAVMPVMHIMSHLYSKSLGGCNENIYYGSNKFLHRAKGLHSCLCTNVYVPNQLFQILGIIKEMAVEHITNSNICATLQYSRHMT